MSSKCNPYSMQKHSLLWARKPTWDYGLDKLEMCGYLLRGNSQDTARERQACRLQPCRSIY